MYVLARSGKGCRNPDHCPKVLSQRHPVSFENASSSRRCMERTFGAIQVSELGKKLKDSSGKPDDCTMVNKRTERIGKYAYHFYGFWKITGLNLCFLDLRKPSPQTNYDSSNLVKWYWVNKWKHLPFFSIWPLQRLETLRVPVTLSDKLGRLSH